MLKKKRECECKSSIFFVVAGTCDNNFAQLQVAQETQWSELLVLTLTSAVRAPLQAVFFLPPPASTLARPRRGPSRERSLPRLLSFRPADREKEGRACRRGPLSWSRECDRSSHTPSRGRSLEFGVSFWYRNGSGPFPLSFQPEIAGNRFEKS